MLRPLQKRNEGRLLTKAQRGLYALVSALALCVSAPQSAEAESVRFAVGIWPPYIESAQEGLAMELVEAVCAAAGIEPSFAVYPWRRAEQNAREGADDATFPYASTERKSADFYVSDILFTGKAVITCKDHTVMQTLKNAQRIYDLKKYAFGVIASSEALTDFLSKAGIRFEETESVEKSLDKLMLGRIDAVIDDESIIAYHLAAGGSKYRDLKLTGSALLPNREYRILVGRKVGSILLLERLNAGIARIRENGTLQRILDAAYR